MGSLPNLRKAIPIVNAICNKHIRGILTYTNMYSALNYSMASRRQHGPFFTVSFPSVVNTIPRRRTQHHIFVLSLCAAYVNHHRYISSVYHTGTRPRQAPSELFLVNEFRSMPMAALETEICRLLPALPLLRPPQLPEGWLVCIL